jgi:hypothetical protein
MDKELEEILRMLVSINDKLYIKLPRRWKKKKY